VLAAEGVNDLERYTAIPPFWSVPQSLAQLREQRQR
jgi:hypothetical protein